ncbi:MAG: Xaa-Pro dipeptidase, partial [Lachnospiraceae bacterium]|nr:Xaa-Pro dipeptidase [Lachnospiraceae bacterium]
IGDGRSPDDVLKKYGEEQMDTVRRAMQLGVKLAPGSDAGAYRVPHVKGFLDELDWMMQAAGEEREQMKEILNQGAWEIAKRFRRS